MHFLISFLYGEVNVWNVENGHRQQALEIKLHDNFEISFGSRSTLN